MNARNRRRFESILPLFERAWEQFNARRSYELKISLAIWTALAAAIAGSLTIKEMPDIPWFKPLLLIVGAGTFILHWSWCKGIGTASAFDREIAKHYERQLQALTESQFSTQLLFRAHKIKGRMGKWWAWSYRFQIGVTLFLVSLLIATNWTRYEEGTESQEIAVKITPLAAKIQKVSGEVHRLNLDIEVEVRNATSPKAISDQNTSPAAVEETSAHQQR